MQVKEVLIDSIFPYPENPREIEESQFEKLQKSIREFGFVEPLVVNLRDHSDYKPEEKMLTIVGGNMRWRAAKALGMKEVPIVEVNLNRAREAALNIGLNRIAGRWDVGKLEKLVYDLSNADLDIDLDLTGLDDWELKLYNPGKDIEGTENVELPEFLGKEQIKTQTGFGRKLVRPSQLFPSGINPNQMTEKEFEGLKGSIKEIGIINPITVYVSGDNRLVIVDGEHRWQAAKALGLKTVPVTVVDMTEGQAKVAILASNRIKGRFNTSVMSPIIKDISESKEGSEILKKVAAMSNEDIERYKGLEGSPLVEGVAGRREMRDYEAGKDYKENYGETVTLMIVLPQADYQLVVKKLNEINDDWVKAIVQLCNEGN